MISFFSHDEARIFLFYVTSKELNSDILFGALVWSLWNMLITSWRLIQGVSLRDSLF